jgi:hypothetical protein
VRALARLSHDIGSVAAEKIDPLAAPDGARFMTVALVDAAQIGVLAEDLRRELAGDRLALALTDRVLVMPLPLDACLLVFLDIAAVMV